MIYIQIKYEDGPLQKEYLLRICIRSNKHIRSIQISFDHCLRKNIQIAVGVVISFTVRSNAFFVRYQFVQCLLYVPTLQGAFVNWWINISLSTSSWCAVFEVSKKASSTPNMYYFSSSFQWWHWTKCNRRLPNASQLKCFLNKFAE